MTLVCAPNENQAYKSALKLGKIFNYSYQNSKKEIVTWKFAGISKMISIPDKLTDGSILYEIAGQAKNLENIKRLKYKKSEIDSKHDKFSSNPTDYIAWILFYKPIRADNKKEIKYFKRKELIVYFKAKDKFLAYNKALKLGKKFVNRDEKIYNNNWKLAGLSDLLKIYDSIEHGGELSYYEGFVRDIDKIHKMIPPKNELEIFTEKNS
ncbi:MAG: DUF4288 domain-containing protein [Bacteroidetes bacterium]|nr:DUF4288 domain-containing protein [Bacteroidota bacterium]